MYNYLRLEYQQGDFENQLYAPTASLVWQQQNFLGQKDTGTCRACNHVN